MLYLKKPLKFNSAFEVVGCFCEQGEKILLLHRQDDKIEGDKWGCPAGKVETGESLTDAIKRELKEETGLQLGAEQFNLEGKFYVRYPNFDFVYYIFTVKINDLKDFDLNVSENKNYIWVTPERALLLPLLLDEDSIIKSQYKV